MENKKTIIAIIILSVLIIGLAVVAYKYNDFNTNQISLLTQELNKILESNIAKDNIDFEIKTDRNYAIVEKSIKEYTLKLKNIYVEMNEMVEGINPNIIFTAENMQDKNLEEVQKITDEYKEKSQNFISEYESLVSEKKIIENINNQNISTRKDYYVELYNEVMLGDIMRNKYNSLEEKIKNEKGELYDKLNKIEKIKKFLEEHEDSWMIKDNKIQFTNLNRMTEYYNLLNQLID